MWLDMWTEQRERAFPFSQNILLGSTAPRNKMYGAIHAKIRSVKSQLSGLVELLECTCDPKDFGLTKKTKG